MAPLDLITQHISLTKRPDAISFDYLYAFTTGPVDFLNADEGLFARAWRVRCDNDLKKIFISRANADNTDWEPEIELLTFVGDPFDEVDIAFDQQGNVAVSGSRGTEIWLYFYDPTIPGYAFTLIAEGRTPRIALDNPFGEGDTDVLLFYVNATNDSIVYRQQRDRYEIEYDSGREATANTFIEDCGWTTDSRFLVMVSERNAVSGRYTQSRIYTTLYPYIALDNDSGEVSAELTPGLLVDVVISIDSDVDEGITTAVLLDSLLVEPIIDVSPNEIAEPHHIRADTTDGQTTATLRNSLLVQPIIMVGYEDQDEEQGRTVATLLNSVLAVVVIQHNPYDSENGQTTATLLGGTLV